MRKLQKPVRFHDAGDQMPLPVCLPAAVQAVGSRLLSPGCRISGVFQEAVFQFLRRRLLRQRADHPRLRNVDAVFQFKIPGYEITQENASAAPV